MYDLIGRVRGGLGMVGAVIKPYRRRWHCTVSRKDNSLRMKAVASSPRGLWPVGLGSLALVSSFINFALGKLFHFWS